MWGWFYKRHLRWSLYVSFAILALGQACYVSTPIIMQTLVDGMTATIQNSQGTIEAAIRNVI